ncbi:hypothetical protein NPIL_243581 [Nephila pilipes]|uniref:Uncharacterized protein n=1 Tax=Nephila pilipes TaxID=299642 RepID=A0A8X6QPP0_NEPPI|nr:hypothetical protein NPIL_243581 [Nephila pilipes]
MTCSSFHSRIRVPGGLLLPGEQKESVSLIADLTTPTRMGFEPTRAEPNGLAVHRLNHSATSSSSEAEFYFRRTKRTLFNAVTFN